jgi:hypothetical protein
MKKYHGRFRTVGILVVITILLCITATGYLFYDQAYGFGAPAHPDYTGYKPTVLPNDIRVVGDDLKRTREAGLNFWDFNYSIVLSKDDFTIHELRKSPYRTGAVSCEGIGNLCTTHKTPGGTVYTIAYGVYKEKPFGLDVEWVAGDTHLIVSVDDSVITNYMGYDWAPMIDGMQPVDLSDKPFTKINATNKGV